MNNKITYQIEFFSYWHAGSGLSGSTYADSIVLKNEQGLPIIPGKTMKGLLREAAETINQLNQEMVKEEFIILVFGEREKEGNSGKRKEGISFFGNIGLSKNLSENIIEANLSKTLYQVVSSTQIDENGQARDHSLRQLEVTVPLILYGEIEQFPSDYREQLQYCFNWIKQIGVNRNRGLGKCKLTIIN